MFDEISLSTIAIWSGATAIVGAAIGLLRRSVIRYALIISWTALPLIWILLAVSMTALDTGDAQWAMSFGFVVVFTLMLLPPWALLTLLPFNLVRRCRDVQRWEL